MSERSHLSWGAEALWEQLQPLLPGLSVEVVARTDSTNTRLLERARATPARGDLLATEPGTLEPATPLGRRSTDLLPCLLVAEEQTHGRGRQGRPWYASAGASLTFSLSLPMSPADWSGLSLAVGLAVAEALEPQPATPRIGLKWPNDLWLLDAPGQGRKLGGVLIETVAAGAHRVCVVGVGLNILPLSLQGLGTGYGCLQELDAQATAPQALATIAAPLVRALRRFQVAGFAPLREDYARRDLLRGQTVTTTQPGVPEGVAEGVDARGALIVRAGDEHRVVSGEVSIRPTLAPDAHG